MASKDETDLYWGMYQENTAQARHHETQRQTVSSLTIGLVGVLLSLVAIDRSIAVADLPLGVFLMLLGAWGAFFSIKQYERASLHMERARHYRTALDEAVPTARLTAIKQAADRINEADWPRFSRLRLYGFWISLHAIVALVGLVVVVLALTGPHGAPG